MEKSQTEDDLRLEKNEHELCHPVVTTSAYNQINEQLVIKTTNGPHLLTTLGPLTTNAETQLCNTTTCYLVTKDHSTGDISSDVPPTPKQPIHMSIIKLPANNLTDSPVYICRLAVKPKQLITSTSEGDHMEVHRKSSTVHHQCKASQNDNQASRIPNQLSATHQSAFKSVSKHGTSENCCLEPDSTTSKDHYQNGQMKSSSTPRKLPFDDQSTTNPNHESDHGQTKSPSTPRKLPVHDQSTTNPNRQSEHGQTKSPSTPRKLPFDDQSTTNPNHQSEQGQTKSPSTPRKLPVHDQSTTNPKLEYSPLKSCYLGTGSWDPLCHHIDDSEKNVALPHDLRYLKESELLPMAHGDFRRCLKEDLYCAPTEMMTSADDDGVVPSSPALLLGDDARCYSSDASTDGSQEYPWGYFSARNDNIYKSPSLAYEYPQYGTLNWGLSPTIIYKTPDPETSVQSDGYMKCSISKGNVELLTPPPPNYKKLLRRSRRRMERRDVKRRRIHFGNDENYQGLQEVPVNESEKDDEKSLDTDFVPDDPMWFEDENETALLADSEDKTFSVREQNIVDCYENLRDALPTSEETTPTFQILTEAVEYIKNLEETLGDFNVNGREENIEVIEDESEKPEEFNAVGCKDALEILPQFSWNDIDEPSYEIQEILDSISLPEEASVEDYEEDEPSTDLFIEEEKPEKRKRKYQKNSTRKTKTPRKKRKSSKIKTKQSQNDNKEVNDSDGNSNSQRSNRRSNSSSRSSSRGSRSVTPIMPKPTPGVMVSPSFTGFIPLQTIGKPLILPKPPSRAGCFSPTTLPSPLTSPQLIPAKKCRSRARNKEVVEEKERPVPESELQKKTIPNGYMLYCKKMRKCVFEENPDLKSKPGDITKLLSENWNQLSEKERRPYVNEAMKLRYDENKWFNQTL